LGLGIYLFITVGTPLARSIRLPTTLTPNRYATFQVQFKPDSAKTFTGKLTFSMRGTKNQLVNVSDTGWNVNAAPSLNTTSLDFGNQALGTNNPSQNVKITNAGSAAVKLTGVTVTSPFSQTGWTTSTTIAAGGAPAWVRRSCE